MHYLCFLSSCTEGIETQTHTQTSTVCSTLSAATSFNSNYNVRWTMILFSFSLWCCFPFLFFSYENNSIKVKWTPLPDNFCAAFHRKLSFFNRRQLLNSLWIDDFLLFLFSTNFFCVVAHLSQFLLRNKNILICLCRP